MNEFRNDRLVVRYDEGICTHAGKCVQNLPAVFDPNRDPWVDVSRADVGAIVNAVRACPSGALTCETIRDNTGR